MPAVQYRFGEFEVDVLAYELRRGGHRARLARQPMDLLLLLLERPQEMVSREDIAKRLWTPGVHIDLDAGIHTAILKVRQVLGDTRESPQFVETVPGKGYRFVAPVEVITHSPPRERSELMAAGGPLHARRHNLPADLTSFVGRRKELLELPRVLTSSRLLSLTGAGGVGKTRLALRLAGDLVNEFRDGVWLIDLAPLSLPELVAQTIASTLGVREGAQRSARDVLLDTLRDRELLLVLDTCEHLIDSCAELVEVLLREAPALRIVATSREALGVFGENVYRVPSLSLPEVLSSVPAELIASEAMQLFVERASAVDPAFTATSHNASVIARLCRRLDGIPLAIELAAARIAVLSPEQIEARLQDRFRLLTGGARRAVARQRTLEATVDWSYHLLSDVERLLLSRLSVFPATWSLEAAEHVCDGDGISAHDLLELLSRLVRKSVVVVDQEFAGARRYRLLETVRQYARERLVQSGAADLLNERHFEYFFAEFRGVLPILRHHDQLPCLRRLQIEQENVRVSLDWALTSASHAVKGVELAGALFWFWTKHGLYEEGKLWLERARAVAGDVPRGLQARVLIGLTHMHHFQGRSFEAVIAEALSLGREEGDAWAMSFALFMQGLAALQRGEHEQAQALALDAREAANASGEAVQHGGPLLILGKVAESNGDHERAQQLYDESIDVHRCVGDKWGLSILLSVAAGLRIVRKDFDQARIQASEAMSLCQELDDPRGIAWSLDLFASLLAAAGHSERAARLWGAADRLLESVGGSPTPEISGMRDRYVASAKTSIGVGAFETARAEGRAMPFVHAIALAREPPPSRRLRVSVAH
jgi:predicted ATPase/DNA-binding winged helix-turn-helix (wHTH) protein